MDIARATARRTGTRTSGPTWPSATVPTDRPLAAPLVSPWAIGIAAGVTLGLLALAGGYGWHRDELYFVVAGRHPARSIVTGPAQPAQPPDRVRTSSEHARCPCLSCLFPSNRANQKADRKTE